MKKLWLLLFTLLTSISYSQVTSGSSEMGNVEKENYYTVMALQNWNMEKLNRENATSGNNLFIEQVGSNNIIQSNVSSPDAVVNLRQNGNSNGIDVQLESQNARYNVVQTGNNNYLQDQTYAPYETAKLNLYQTGNENQVFKYGTNSITNKLEFNIVGDSRSIIIRSFQ